MRKGTFQKADIYIAYAYYDWGQRPCPSPPLTTTAAAISRSGIIKECLRPCWNAKQLWAVQKNLTCQKYITYLHVSARYIVYMVRFGSVNALFKI